MGVFTTKSFDESQSYYNDGYDIEALMEDSSIDENKYDDNACSQIIYESEMNWSMLMKQIGIAELAAVEDHGEAIYEAADGGNVFKAIANFFKNLLEKIKTLFKKLALKLTAASSDNKKFTSKYKTQLGKIRVPTDFEFKGYKFTNLDKEIKDTDIATATNNALGKASKSITISIIDKDNSLENMSAYSSLQSDTTTDFDNIQGNPEVKKYVDFIKAWTEDDKRTEGIDGARADLLGNGDKDISSDDWASELKMYFRNKEEDPDDIQASSISVSTLVSELDESKKELGHLNKNFNNMKKGVDRIIRALDKKANEYNKSAKKATVSDTAQKAENNAFRTRLDKFITCCRYVTDAYRDCLNIAISINNAQNIAWHDRDRQNKAMLIKLLTAKNSAGEGKRAINASANMYDEDDYGVTHTTLDDIKFI